MKRLAGLLATTAIVVSVACGHPTANATVIGVRPPAQPEARSDQVDLTTMSKILADQIAESNDVAAIQGDEWLALGELPIDSTLTINQLERLLGLQEVAQASLQQRLTAISILRGQIAGDALITPNQKARLSGQLDRASAELHIMQVRVAREQLVDQTRVDLKSIGTLRIYAFLLPKIHLMYAAYEIQQLTVIYNATQNRLQLLMNQLPILGTQGNPMQPVLDDLGRQISVMSADSGYALSLLSWQDRSGYPGNKSALRAARQANDRGQAAADVAQADIARVKAYLHI